MRSPWATLLDALLGPLCGMCPYRARGPRGLIAHYWAAHLGDLS